LRSLVDLYRRIVDCLLSRQATESRRKVRTRQVADACGEPAGIILGALKDLEKAGIVSRSPSETSKRRFLIKRIRGRTFPNRYKSDVEYISSLAQKDRRVARMCGGVDLTKLDMWDKQDRETYNRIVEKLRQAGFDNRLGTYDLVAGSYYWWLVPGWNARLAGFMKQQRAN